jgi:hypothetical protein
VAFLLSQRVGDSHDPFGEAATAFTLGSEAAFSPHDEGPQLPFRMIVGGLDTLDIDECPQCFPMLEDVRAASADTVDAKKHAIFKVTFDHRPQWKP